MLCDSIGICTIRDVIITAVPGIIQHVAEIRLQSYNLHITCQQIPAPGRQTGGFLCGSAVIGGALGGAEHPRVSTGSTGLPSVKTHRTDTQTSSNGQTEHN